MQKKQKKPLLKGTVKLSMPNLEKASKIVAIAATAVETNHICQLFPSIANKIEAVTIKLEIAIAKEPSQLLLIFPIR